MIRFPRPDVDDAVDDRRRGGDRLGGVEEPRRRQPRHGPGVDGAALGGEGALRVLAVHGPVARRLVRVGARDEHDAPRHRGDDQRGSFSRPVHPEPVGEREAVAHGLRAAVPSPTRITEPCPGAGCATTMPRSAIHSEPSPVKARPNGVSPVGPVRGATGASGKTSRTQAPSVVNSDTVPLNTLETYSVPAGLSATDDGVGASGLWTTGSFVMLAARNSGVHSSTEVGHVPE